MINEYSTRKIQNSDEIKAIIFDIDNTLAFPTDPDFYLDIGEFVQNLTLKILGTDLNTFNLLRDYYVEVEKSYVEKMYFNINEFKKVANMLNIPLDNLEVSLYFKAFNEIKNFTNMKIPDGVFISKSNVKDLFADIRSYNIKIVALSNCPEILSRRVLSEIDINPDLDFDLYHPWYDLYLYPPKICHPKATFNKIINTLGLEPASVISVGDSLHMDILPARELGVKTAHIDTNFVDLQYINNNTFKSVEDFWSRIKRIYF